MKCKCPKFKIGELVWVEWYRRIGKIEKVDITPSLRSMTIQDLKDVNEKQYYEIRFSKFLAMRPVKCCELRYPTEVQRLLYGD